MSPRPSGYHFARWSAQWLLDVAVSRSAYRRLYWFGLSNELIERLAPAVAEAHAIVRIAILLVFMHGERGVFRSFSVRLHHDDRGEGRNIEGRIGRPEAGRKRHRPGELAARHALEGAADAGYVFAFPRAHRRARDAAGTKGAFESH